MALTIDELNIKIQSEAESAERGIDGLTDALSRLKANLDFASQLAAVASGIIAISKSSGELNKVDFDSFTANMKKLNTALQPLQGFKTQASGLLSSLRGFSETANAFNNFTGFGQFAAQVQTLAAALAPLNSVSGKLGATLTALGQVTQISNGLSGTDFTALSGQVTNLTAALAPLGTLQSKLGSTLNNLSRLGTITKDLNATMATGTLKTDIQNLVGALQQLEGIGKSNLGSVLNQLKKFPEIAKALAGVDMNSFSAGVKVMTEALEPLVTQLNAVSSGFSALPQKVRAVANATDKLKNANNQTSKSYGGLLNNVTKAIGKMTILVMAFKRVWEAMADWFTESSNYIENLNLFTVTMGDATEGALEYANAVQKAMGIDTSDWMKYQGTFQQLATGFGVASDKAAVMSQNLTQLAYDLSSFFNVDVETAFDKLSSGMSGQIKGLKEFGFNLSVAALQEYALSKGIKQKVSSMTEAQKSILRYNLLMEKSVKQQGDMARTLVTPSNAVRILSAQLTQLKRAFGNIVSVVATQVIPYVQAFVENVTEAANRLATMMGFELPKIDYSGLSNAFADAEEDSEGMSNNLKEIKKQLMGFDELNVLSSNESGAGFADDSDWSLELGTYDFLRGLSSEIVLPKWFTEIVTKVENIARRIGVAVGKIKEAFNKIDLSEGKAALDDFIGWLGEHTDGFVNIVTTAFEDVAEFLNTEEFRIFAEGVINIFSLLWSVIKPGLSAANNALADTLAFVGGVLSGLIQHVAGFFELVEGIFTGDGQKVKNGFVRFLSGIVNILSSFVNFLTDSMFNAIEGFVNGVGGGVAKIGEYLGQEGWGWEIDLGNPLEIPKWEVPAYAGGGFPGVGEMFIANEAGPELVGRIGSRTAVVNNDQIVAGITAGVYNAVSAAMQENSDGGSNKRIEIRVPVEIGNRVLGEAVAEWHNGMVKQTGKSPLLT